VKVYRTKVYDPLTQTQIVLGTLRRDPSFLWVCIGVAVELAAGYTGDVGS